jgi:hypothetical protein
MAKTSISVRDPTPLKLTTMGVLSGVSRHDLTAVCGLTTEMHFEPGRVLCRQGARGREVFLVLDGQDQVSRDGQPVCVLGPSTISVLTATRSAELAAA